MRRPRPTPPWRARAIAREVIANHHNLLLGLPGRAAQLTGPERAWLETSAGHDGQPGLTANETTTTNGELA